MINNAFILSWKTPSIIQSWILMIPTFVVNCLQVWNLTIELNEEGSTGSFSNRQNSSDITLVAARFCVGYYTNKTLWKRERMSKKLWISGTHPLKFEKGCVRISTSSLLLRGAPLPWSNKEELGDSLTGRSSWIILSRLTLIWISYLTAAVRHHD